MAVGVGQVLGVGLNLFSGIFKKPQTKDGVGKFKQYYIQKIQEKGIGAYPTFVIKFINGQGMTAKEKNEATKWILQATRNWTKAQKKSLEEACKNIRVIAEPKVQPVTTHTISASYDTRNLVEGVSKSRDVNEPVQTPAKVKISPILIFVGIGALILILALRRS